MKKKLHGGKRKGAGRKPKPHRNYHFKLAIDVADKLDEHKGYETATIMVEEAIREITPAS